MMDGGTDFIRWARLGVWERLLALVQDKGLKLSMIFLDDTNIRAHQKAAGAPRKGDLQRSETAVKRAGRAIRFRIAPGQAHELPHAVPLLNRLPDVPLWVAADRGYTSHAFRSTFGMKAPGPRYRRSATEHPWPAPIKSTTTGTRSNDFGRSEPEAPSCKAGWSGKWSDV